MSNIVQISDFKGFYLIAQGCYGSEQLQFYIDKYEEYYLCKMLGNELKNSLIADLVDGVPTNPEYLEWFNPFCEEITNSCTCEVEDLQSVGVKNLLTGFVYYHFISDTIINNTPTGNTVYQTDTSDKVDFIANQRDADKRHNDSVGSFKSVCLKLENRREENVNFKYLDLV